MLGLDKLPLLKAGSFILREFSYGDVPLIQHVSQDPLIPLITSVATTPDPTEARAFIDRQNSRLSSGKGISFAIAESQTNEAVGQIGLWPREDNRASIGYWISSHHRQRGIASQALRSVSKWGLALPELERLELYVEPWNEGSWRTAERIGYQREGLLRSWQQVGDQRRDMYMYSALPGEIR